MVCAAIVVTIARFGAVSNFWFFPLAPPVLWNFSNASTPKDGMNHLSTPSRLLLLIILATLLSACFNRDRQPIYVGSEEVSAIRAPEGFSQPRVRSTHEIPGYFLPELAAVGNEARPPRVLTSAEAEASRSHLRFGATGLHLEVEDEPDSVWRRLGFTLDRGRMSIESVDDEQRLIAFRFDHDPIVLQRRGFGRAAFWRSPERIDFRGVYQVQVLPSGDNARVALFDQRGDLVELDRAEFVLAVLRERLG